MASSPMDNLTIVISMATERQNVGEAGIKATTETTIRLQESPTSTGNAITAEKEATGMFIVRRGKKNRKTMTLITSSWEPHNVDNFKNIKMNNISNNG